VNEESEEGLSPGKFVSGAHTLQVKALEETCPSELYYFLAWLKIKIY